MSVSRRNFLEVTALGSLAAYCPVPATGATASLPTRVLGKTGVRVSILAMGGGSRYLQYQDEDRAIKAVQKALDLGITYIDTSDDYGNDHLSERRIGKALKGRGEPVFLATKLTHRDGAETARIVEQSLSALQRDHVDLIHIHSLTTEDDLARIEAKGGVLEQLQKLRDQKITRFIGITSHTDPSVLKMALERHDFDCTQMALNAALVGMKSGKNGMVPNEAIKTSFETVALPVASRKQMGVIAMKVFAQDALIGQATPEKLLHYSLSLPVTTAVTGMPKFEHIEENV
jgi:predicted aldo/keto reductase-like oxidoreductase